MKATGIVRRIDDLGRVVIPKEIRRTLRIREGDPLEIFTDREGEVILKKYSPIGELSAFAKQYADSLAATAGCTVCVTDHDQMIAVAGPGRKELQEKRISKQMEHALDARKQLQANIGDKNYVYPTEDKTEEYASQIVSPIICEGDVIGSVLILEKDEKRKFGEAEQKLALCAADFLGRQLEQ